MVCGKLLLIDEISLASDAILERLNSVFETDRQLTIAEKPGAQQIQACNMFKVVSTMNPGGDYGKKELSPALRNRMTEIFVHGIDNYEDIESIVSRRCAVKLEDSDKTVSQALSQTFVIVKGLAKQEISIPFTFSIRDIVGIADYI